MHRKSDSDLTSVDASSPPRSPRRPVYYVQSPSQHDAEKMSAHSSPLGSPHFYYHCSPIHHSRESSTTRFSASAKNLRSGPWKKLQTESADDGDEGDEEEEAKQLGPKFYIFCFVFSFCLLFTLFSLILLGASRHYKPKISMKSIVFEDFNVQAGTDGTGVQTKMLSMKSTVKMGYRNPATFFGVHVSSSHFGLYYYDLEVASGQMEEFYESRKSQRVVSTEVVGKQVPLYGVGASLGSSSDVVMPLNLTFLLRSRAYVLGKLVKPKFYRRVTCQLTLKAAHLGNPIHLNQSCHYH